MGLVSVGRLVKQLGGTIGVHSDGPGHGCTFTVALPRVGPSASQRMHG